MHRRLQKVFKNFKVGGTDLNAQKVTRFFNNFKVGGSHLTARIPD